MMPPKKATPAKKATSSSKAKLNAAAKARVKADPMRNGIGNPWIVGKPGSLAKRKSDSARYTHPVRGDMRVGVGDVWNRAYRKNVENWKAIGELGKAYSLWLDGLAKQSGKPVRGGGGMAPGKKAKRR